MKKTKATQLVRALRSGNYHQGQGQLVDKDDCFCCLGVACNISKADLEWGMSYIGEGQWYIGGSCVTLPSQVQEEFGFFSYSGERRDGKDIIINGKYYADLAEANDEGCTFEQLADYIEQHYEVL